MVAAVLAAAMFLFAFPQKWNDVGRFVETDLREKGHSCI